MNFIFRKLCARPLVRGHHTKISLLLGECPLPLDLNNVRDRNIEDLSGGELQRFACAIVCVQRADV